MSKTILALDTAMSGCSVAVLSGGDVIAESLPMPRGQSEELMPMIDRVLKSAGVEPAKLDTICVTRGPGAFTGLRIGLSAARALGSALNKPVVGVTTSDVLAKSFLSAEKLTVGQTLCVLIETKREDFYFQLFDHEGTAKTEPAALPAADIVKQLDGNTILIGDALTRFRDVSGYNGDYREGYNLPNPAIMAQMAADGAAGPAEPLYLRGADVTIGKARVVTQK